MNYFAWAVMIALQQFSFTVVSRARNSNSILYGTIASVFSNGIWFAQTLYMTKGFMDVINSGEYGSVGVMGAVYVTVNVAASAVAQYACIRWFEKKKQ